jgi:phospholipase/carboxylesterase
MPPITTNFEDWTIRVQSPEKKPARVMVMLHGWTGNEESMWFFSKNLSHDYWLLAPRAPYPAPQGGFSWRPLAPSTAFPPTYEQLQPSAARLNDLIERWGIAYSVEIAQVDMMGFSQGAAMTVTFALTYPQRIRKLAVLSGFTPAAIDNLVITKPLAGKSTFIAHGSSDEMVPIEMAHQTHSILERAGSTITFCEANVGHKVSADCVRALGLFFSS